jgi:hypothetical protein
MRASARRALPGTRNAARPRTRCEANLVLPRTSALLPAETAPGPAFPGTPVPPRGQTAPGPIAPRPPPLARIRTAGPVLPRTPVVPCARLPSAHGLQAPGACSRLLHARCRCVRFAHGRRPGLSFAPGWRPGLSFPRARCSCLRLREVRADHQPRRRRPGRASPPCDRHRPPRRPCAVGSR